MKVLTNEQMRAVDARARTEFGIAEQALMEEAGRAVARIARERFEPRFALVVCGKGNNAGDGYVAARYLKQAGTNVKVVAVGEPSSLKGAAEVALREAEEAGVSIVSAAELRDHLSHADLVV
ncbi:MAG: NAD(P)H-hydrate epimerase, partial [Candidatus Sumerlaeaceae bacterium]